MHHFKFVLFITDLRNPLLSLSKTGLYICVILGTVFSLYNLSQSVIWSPIMFYWGLERHRISVPLYHTECSGEFDNETTKRLNSFISALLRYKSLEFFELICNY